MKSLIVERTLTSVYTKNGGSLMDDKQKKNNEDEKAPQTNNEQNKENEEKIFDMKQQLEDYLEEQGIYIRQ